MFETTCQTNMQFFNAIILLILRLMRQVILAERNHFCEAMVIQECSDNAQGLLKAIESRNQRLLIKECDALQVSHTIYISLKTEALHPTHNSQILCCKSFRNKHIYDKVEPGLLLLQWQLFIVKTTDSTDRTVY